jgi:hypothetical protein
MSEMKVSKNIKKEKKIVMCSVCNNFITHNLCFCDKLDYHNKNIDSIIKIQRWITVKNYSKLNKITDDTIIDIVKNNIIKNNTFHNNLFIKCQKVLKMYPPSKNEYKFIYGMLIQMIVIELLNNIFYSCIDLDNFCKYGSEYKVDCRLNITRYLYRHMSIKAKKNKSGKIIIINKLNNNKHYDLSQLITIIIILELNDIIIIPHTVIPDKYIEHNDSHIAYKSGLFTYLYKVDEYKKYIIHLHENDEYKTFYKNELPLIYPHNIYSDCFSKL